MDHLITAGVAQLDAQQTRAYIANVSTAPELMNREPRVVARWIGDSRSKVTFGDAALYLGGDGDLNPMQAILGAFAACDVDLVAMHAALLDIEIVELWIEASGPFHVARYLGLDSEQSPGYQHIDYSVHLHVRGATKEQIARLQELCETGSPVGDTLNRPVPTRLTLDIRDSWSAPTATAG
jgi:uncharacterized OsmC-like protein